MSQYSQKKNIPKIYPGRKEGKNRISHGQDGGFILGQGPRVVLCAGGKGIHVEEKGARETFLMFNKELA